MALTPAKTPGPGVPSRARLRARGRACHAVTRMSEGDDFGLVSRATKVCPDCAETVLAQARRCRFCGYRFDAGRSEQRSLLEQLSGGLIRRERPAGLGEVLADWGFEIREGEQVRFFRPAAAERRRGYLLVTDRRLVFFAVAGRNRHEQLLQRELAELRGVQVVRRLSRRDLVLTFDDERRVLRDDGARRDLDALVYHLGEGADS